MKYSKNILTNKIIKGNLGSNLLTGDWVNITGTQEADDFDLQEAKDSKIVEIKANRKKANQKDFAIQALEIVDNNNGSFTETTTLVDFAFRVAETGDKTTEGDKVLNRALRNKDVRYSSAILEDPVRKGYVKINATKAGEIEDHIALRVQSNIAYANQLEKQVNDCMTTDNINNIDVTFI